MQPAIGPAPEDRLLRVVALACALLANGLLVWCLLHLDQQRNGAVVAPGMPVASAALQVQWIDAPRPAPPARAKPAREPARATPAGNRPLRAPHLPQRATLPTPSNVDTPGLAAAPSRDTPLDLTLHAPVEPGKDRYRRSLLDRPTVASMAAAPVIAVRMRDASIGGLLGRMTRNTRCADLHAALPSADGMRLLVILEAMQTHGCR